MNLLESILNLNEANNKAEIELVNKVADYVKQHKLRVPSPNYLETNKYSPQWKVLGSVYYYQLPDRTIIATYDTATKVAKFSENGLHKPMLK